MKITAQLLCFWSFMGDNFDQNILLCLRNVFTQNIYSRCAPSSYIFKVPHESRVNYGIKRALKVKKVQIDGFILPFNVSSGPALIRLRTMYVR